MNAPRDLRNSLGRLGKRSYSKPVDDRSNGLNKIREQAPSKIGDGIDCTASGRQEVPLGYNPSLKDEILHSQPPTLVSIVDNRSNNVQEGSDTVSLSHTEDRFDINQLPELSDDGMSISSLDFLEIGSKAEDPVENDLDSLAALERAHQTIQVGQEVHNIWACTICWEHKNPSEFPTRAPTGSCYHSATECCLDCLSSSIILSTKTRYWNDIRCPACDENIDYEGMMEFAPEEVFKEYDRRILTRHLSTLPNFRHCTSPNCNFGQIHPSVDLELDSLPERIACSLCLFISCSRHNVPWHEGETCDEFDARLAIQNKHADKGSKKEVKRITKACPKKSCGLRIDKNGGCQHMTCLCEHEFCWDCLKEYPYHKWTCPLGPFYSRRLRSNRHFRRLGTLFRNLRGKRREVREDTEEDEDIED